VSIFSARMIERFVEANPKPSTDPRDGDPLISKIMVLKEDYVTNIISDTEIHSPHYTPIEKAKLQRVLYESGWLPPGKPRKELLPDDGDDLSKIHNRIVRYLRRYVWFTDDNSYDLVAGWVLSTYFRESFHYAPILILDGVTVSGKSTTLKVLNQIVYRGTYLTSYSAAALARIIESDGPTMLLDEIVGNLQTDRGIEVCELLKAAFEDGNLLIRADPKSQRIYKNRVYTHIAIAVKAAGLPEDVYNRGLRINMIGMPEGHRLGDIDSIREDEDTLDDLSPMNIRTALYSLRWAYLGGVTQDTFHLDLKGHMQKTKRHLTEQVEEGEWRGQWLYAFVNDLKNAPEIRGRARNIASTLYTMGLITLSGAPIIKMIADSIDANREIIIDTAEAVTFMGMVDAVFAKRGDLYKNMGVGKINIDTFDKILENVSTTDVAFSYNKILKDQGNAGRDDVPTKTITSKILALGFEYKRGRQNRSYFIPQHVNFKPFFMRYLRMWAPEYLDDFDIEEVRKKG